MNCFCNYTTKDIKKTILDLLPSTSPSLRTSVIGILIGMNQPIISIMDRIGARDQWDAAISKDVMQLLATISERCSLNKAAIHNLAKNVFIARHCIFQSRVPCIDEHMSLPAVRMIDDLYASELDSFPLWSDIKEMYYLSADWKGRIRPRNNGVQCDIPNGDLYPDKPRFDNRWELGQAIANGEVLIGSNDAIGSIEVKTLTYELEWIVCDYINHSVNRPTNDSRVEPFRDIEARLEVCYKEHVARMEKAGKAPILFTPLFRMILSKLNIVASVIRSGEFGVEEKPAARGNVLNDEAPALIQCTVSGVGLGKTIKSEEVKNDDPRQDIVREYVEHYILPLVVPSDHTSDENGYVVLPMCHKCLMNVLGAKLWMN